MFSDNILKLINNSVFHNYTLNLTYAFLTLPLTVLCTVILFDVTDYTNFFIVLVFLFFSFFPCSYAVKSAAVGNNYI